MDFNELKHNNQELDIDGQWVKVEDIDITKDGWVIFTMVDGRKFEYKLSGYNHEAGEWWDVEWDSIGCGICGISGTHKCTETANCLNVPLSKELSVG